METINNKIYMTQIFNTAEKLEAQQTSSRGSFEGMENAAQTFVSHLMTAMFPQHFGSAKEYASLSEKRRESLRKHTMHWFRHWDMFTPKLSLQRKLRSL